MPWNTALNVLTIIIELHHTPFFQLGQNELRGELRSKLQDSLFGVSQWNHRMDLI